MINRLWADEVAEILENMPRDIQRQFGFSGQRTKVRIKKPYSPNYVKIAKKLGEFTFAELNDAIRCDRDNLYSWIKRMSEKGAITKRPSGWGNRKIYRWVGE